MKFEIESEGNNIVCDIISLFKDEKTNNDYLIYTDNTTDLDGKKNIYGSRYKNNNGQIELLEIENDSEWDLIDEKIRGIDNEIV